jgi:hypothetical protein
MFANCVQYNNEGTKAHEDGKKLEYCFQEHRKKREAWIAQLASNIVTTALPVRPKQASQRETREASASSARSAVTSQSDIRRFYTTVEDAVDE